MWRSICLSAALLVVFCASCVRPPPAPTPLEQFESFVEHVGAQLDEQLAAGATRLVPGTFKYNVTKTDSLVSPLVGTVSYQTESAITTSEGGREGQALRCEWTFHYAWQKDAWVYQKKYMEAVRPFGLDEISKVILELPEYTGFFENRGLTELLKIPKEKAA